MKNKNTDKDNIDFDTRVLALCEQDTRLMVSKYGSQFLETDCPVCSWTNGHLFANKWDLTYKYCVDCGLIYLSPYPGEDIRNWYFENSEGLEY